METTGHSRDLASLEAYSFEILKGGIGPGGRWITS